MKKLISGMIIGAAIIGGTATVAISGYQAVIESKEAQIERLENEIHYLKQANAEYYQDITFRSDWQSLGEFKITYYWPGEDEWGDMTSTGVKAVQGITVAADPDILPYGTQVLIEGNVYTVQDTGSALKGKKIIDIYVEEPKQEMYYTEVFVRGN